MCFTSAESLGDTGLQGSSVTHQGNASVVSMLSKAFDLLQKGAHAVFSSRALQQLLTPLPYLPVAENLPLFQQGWCKCIHFLHRLTVQLHTFPGELQSTFVSNWFTFCNTKKSATGPRLKDTETSWVQGKQVTIQRCPEDLDKHQMDQTRRYSSILHQVSKLQETIEILVVFTLDSRDWNPMYHSFYDRHNPVWSSC